MAATDSNAHALEKAGCLRPSRIGFTIAYPLDQIGMTLIVNSVLYREQKPVCGYTVKV